MMLFRLQLIIIVQKGATMVLVTFNYLKNVLACFCLFQQSHIRNFPKEEICTFSFFIIIILLLLLVISPCLYYVKMHQRMVCALIVDRLIGNSTA